MVLQKKCPTNHTPSSSFQLIKQYDNYFNGASKLYGELLLRPTSEAILKPVIDIEINRTLMGGML